MEQYNEKASVSSRLSRIFTKKRVGGLAAVLALALAAGGGASYYGHTQARAAHAQERAAMSQLSAIQAEKLGVTLLSEAQIRSIAADAIGQEETAVTFDEIDLMTGEQSRALKEKMPDGRDGHKKDKPKEKRSHGGDDAPAPQTAQARAGAPDGDAAARRGNSADARAMQRPDGPVPVLPGAAGNTPDGSSPEDAQPMTLPQPADAADQQSAMRAPQSGDAPQDATGAPRSRFAPGPHFTYLVHCTANGMHYTFRIDAVSGQVFPQSVRAAR